MSDAEKNVPAGGTGLSTEGAAETLVTEAPAVRPYDFRNPSRLRETDLHQLKRFHENVARYVTSSLSLFLRREVSVQLATVDACSYGKFVETLSDPGHLCLFRLDPLPGIGLLNLDIRLALAWIDRMLGGTGEAPEKERPLTEVEVALVEDALSAILLEWCRPWADEVELVPEILGHEVHHRFVQTTSPETVMVAAAFRAGDEEDGLHFELAMPLSSVEPLFKQRRDRRDRDLTAKAAAGAGVWSPVYDEVMLPVAVEWQKLEMTLGELAALKEGDVVELPAESLSSACIRISNSPKFTGTVGVDNGKVAVMLNET